MSEEVEEASRKPDPNAPFNYVVGLHLLFIAFGLGKVLDGVGIILKHRVSGTLCGAHILTTAFVGLQLLQNAWASFENYSVTDWTLRRFALICSTPFLYIIVADLLFPEGLGTEGDFAGVYAKNVWLMASLAIAGQITSTITVHQVRPPSSMRVKQDWIRGAAMVLLACLFFRYPEHKIVHLWSLGALCLALALYVAVSTQKLDLTGRLAGPGKERLSNRADPPSAA